MPMASASAPVNPPTALLDSDERAFLRRLIFYGFLARALVALVLDWTGYAARFAPDQETYETSGWQMALYWAGEILVKPWRFTTDQPLGYFYLNALSFYVFGHTELPLKLVNALLGAV